MPRIGLRKRWIIPASACVVVLAGAALRGVWWSESAKRTGSLEEARAAYHRQDWRAAERLARALLRKNHQDLVALGLLARALCRQARDPAAIALFERLPRATWEAEDFFLLGQASVRSDNVRRAIELWRNGIQLDANHVELRVALEQVLFRSGRLSEAEPEAAALLAQPGHEALGNLMLGQIRAQQSDPAGAVRALTLALGRPEQWSFMVDPNLAHKLLAREFLRTGQPALAREQLLRLGGLDRDPETCWLLSRCDIQQALAADPAVLALSLAYRHSHLLEPEPAPFVGEARCATCHAEIARDQHNSRHARTFFRRHELPPVRYPQGPIADPQNAKVTHAFEKRPDGLEIQTRAAGDVYRTIVDYAFGSGDKGLTFVGHEPDQRSLEYRLSFYPDRVGWDVTTGQVPKPEHAHALYQGKPLSADDVRRCINCHTTAAQPMSQRSGVHALDRAIGCERCHGPGGHHLAVMSKKFAESDHGLDLAIARPAQVSGPAIVGLCAECHSPPNKGLRLTPGSPESIRFQGLTLTWSRCYNESDGQLDCVTCHNPHRDAATSPRVYESRCLRCHSRPGATSNHSGALIGGAQRGDPATCPIDPAHGCIECHMPRRKSVMAHTAFTDHFIRVHRDADGEPKREP